MTQVLLRIPLRKHIANSINDGTGALEAADIYDVACLTLLSIGINSPITAHTAELKLGKIIADIKPWTSVARLTLYERVATQLKGKIPAALLNASCQFMTDDECNAAEWRDPSGQWIMTTSRKRIYSPSLGRFRSNEEDVLLESQRISTHIRNSEDDHIHIEGVAGAGKTSIIREFSDSMKNDVRSLVVVSTKPLQIGCNNVAITPGDLCFEHVNREYFVNRANNRRNMNVSFASIAERFNIEKRAAIYPDTLTALMMDLISNFCKSDDTSISKKHITPLVLSYNIPLQHDYLINNAKKIWGAMISRGERHLPLPDIAIVKLASFSEFGICADTVVVDELHDSPPSFGKIITANSQHHAVISFGDEWQRTSDDYCSPQLTQYPSKQLRMDQSIRCGDVVEPFIHTICTDLTFRGNDAITSKIIRYHYGFGASIYIPDHPALLITDSYFWIVMAAIKLNKLNLPFNISLSTREHTLQLAGEAIDMKNGFLDRRRHPELMRFTSWKAYLDEQKSEISRGTNEFDRWIRAGKNTEDLRNIFNRGISAYRQEGKGYTIAMVDETKGYEWDRICLLPDLANLQLDVSLSDHMRRKRLYTALTRARREIHLPKNSVLDNCR